MIFVMGGEFVKHFCRKIGFGRKKKIKENIHGFYFQKREIGFQNPLIFKKINAPYRNFAHSIDFFLSYFFEKKFQRGKRKLF